MQQQPFRRLAAFTSALNAILTAHSGDPLLAQQKIADLGGYRSKGKGGKHAHTTGHKHMANVRAARKAHNIAKRK